MTKQELLDTGYFIDNEYLNRYLLLVRENDKTEYTEKHHILPRSYYQLTGLKIDNTKNNIVKLSYANHCKAHWLLYYCTNKELKYANQTAFIIMVNGLVKHTHIKDYTENDFIELQVLKNKLILETETFWSAAEYSFLENNFLQLTDEELACILNKTEIAVMARRTQLHLQRHKMKKFSTTEIDYIKENYHKKSIKKIAKDLNRSIGSILRKSSSLGLKKDVRRKWTEEEILYLKTYATTKSLSELSSHLNRTKLTIKQLCHKLRIKCKRTDLYTIKDLKYIKDNYGKLTAKQIAINLNRSIGSIEHKIHELL